MVGFIDDVLVLAPFRKFLMQVGVVVMVIALAPHYGLMPWPWLSAALAVNPATATTWHRDRHGR